MSDHHRKLERMFHSAAIQEILPEASMQVSEGAAEYALIITDQYFHAAGAMHGAIYFKLLDDAAYFAAASLEATHFILTKSYHIHFRRPVVAGPLKAVGEVKSRDEKQIVAASKIYNGDGKVVAFGEGIFVKGPDLLENLPGYSS